MSAPRPWPSVSPLARFGPVALVLAVLVGAGVVATVKGDDADVAVGTESPSQEDAEGFGADPRLPVTYADAQDDDAVDDFDWGEHCDSSTGRLAIPSVYSPPCVPVWEGDKPWVNASGETVTDNGGETAPGVTADTITVAYYVASPQDLISSAQALGIFDPNDVALRGVEDRVAQGNGMYELYGRQVELVPFQASGDGKNPSTARADARKVAEEIGAFASIGGPTQTAAYQDELARRGVLCIACGYATPDQAYQDDAPYAWGQLASPDQLITGVLDFGVKNLAGGTAQFAGDPAMHDEERVFGLVNYEQDPPVFADLKKRLTERYRRQGFEAEVTIDYLLDMPSLPTQAAGIISTLKREGVTSVVFAGDPLMPIYLTEQATKQDYFPEWIITGTVFTDSTAAGRLYDQEQWAHAFGASALPARTEPQYSEPWRLYEWWYGEEPEATKTLPLFGPVVDHLFRGIHLAGPELTAETFAGGMFNYPVSGGGPTTPQISFGFQGQFEDADYVGVDDFTVVWWDAEAVGPDEQNVEGKGMWRYVEGGERLLLGDVRELDENLLFQDTEDAVAIYEEVPASDQTPAYEPWDESPAAGGG